MAWVDSFFLRQGSNELDRSSSPERSSPVMLSAAKDQRSEASVCRSRQTLRGVYPERSEWAQGDTV
jgi:hypothetical protein